MPSFLDPTPGDLKAQDSPTREFAMQGEKKANARGSAGRGGGGGGWAQLELTDALLTKFGSSHEKFDIWPRPNMIQLNPWFHKAGVRFV